MISDAAGNLYGTTAGGVQGAGGVVYKLSPSGSGWTETVLYSFPAGQDFGVSYATLIPPVPPGDVQTTRIYYDLGVCSTNSWDIYSIDDLDRLPPP